MQGVVFIFITSCKVVLVKMPVKEGKGLVAIKIWCERGSRRPCGGGRKV